jgi:hypothetical protein
MFNLTANLLAFNRDHDRMTQSTKTNEKIQTISTEVFMVVNIHIVAFWIMAMCLSMEHEQQCFRETQCLHLQAIHTL